MDAAPGAHSGASSADAPPGPDGAPAPLLGVPEAAARDESLGALTSADCCAAAVEPVAARAGEKRSRDDNDDAGARKAAASAAAEQEEAGSGGAAVASPIAAAAAAPSVDGAPFFDYAAESKALGDSLFRLPALDAQGGPSMLAGIGAFFGQFQQRSAELRARAVAARFYGFQPHERALALELLNRRRAVPSIRPGVAVADEAWDERRVKANHKKPCVACEEPFNHYGQLFYQECARGPWDADKLCEGCMGAKLRAATGGVTDAEALLALLAPLRAAQPGGIQCGSFAQSYMRRDY